MPITLPHFSRRRFLQGSIVAAAGFAMAPWGRVLAAETIGDPDRLILLSDIHIAADVTLIKSGINMADHLKQAVEQILAADLRGSHFLINGDLAMTSAQPGDYAAVIKLIKPLRETGAPMHLNLGNHDNFERFRAAFPPAAGEIDPVALKQVTVLETPRANLFLLDSLDKTNSTPGVLGEAQLAWLGKQLDARKEKPAVIVVHHQPDLREKGGAAKGITDTAAFYEVILPRKQVKAVVFGHTHRWERTEHEGIALINLPAVAYVFDPKQPSGWTDLKLSDGGAIFTLHALDKAHPQHGEKFEIKWRA